MRHALAHSVSTSGFEAPKVATTTARAARLQWTFRSQCKEHDPRWYAGLTARKRLLMLRRPLLGSDQGAKHMLPSSSTASNPPSCKITG